MDNRPRKPWRALFDGEERQEFLDAAERIAQALTEPRPDLFPEQIRAGHENFQGAGFAAELAGGRAGLALFFFYRNLACSPHRECEITGRLLNQALEMIPLSPPYLGLYSGLPGVVWAATHIQAGLWADPREQPPPQADEDPFAPVDDLLLKSLSTDRWDGSFDLVSGLVGLGVYALERLPRAAAESLLSLVLERLADLAREQEEGIAWLTPPGRLREEALARAPLGCFDLGVAHGNPGVIGFLSSAYAAGQSRAGPLLDGAVSWMLAQRPLAGSRALFPYWTAPHGAGDRPTRLGWCYGAPGIAVSLLKAGRSTGNPDWEAAALDLARHAARVEPEDGRIRDAGLCHGAAGAGHLFNRMHQATGDAELQGAACFWLRKALAMSKPGQGIGGFLTYYPREGSDDPWTPDAGLVTGAAGIGLAFLAAAAAPEPRWDRLLLMDVT